MVLYVWYRRLRRRRRGVGLEPIPGQRFLAPLLGVALVVELGIAVLASSLLALVGPDVKSGFSDPAAIGYLLLEKFLLPFEASSILLLLAAVGAIVLAGRKREGRSA